MTADSAPQGPTLAILYSTSELVDMPADLLAGLAVYSIDEPRMLPETLREVLAELDGNEGRFLAVDGGTVAIADKGSHFDVMPVLYI